jgi:predicted Zn finger-like uncharacterized protein/prepilin-type processing-associated H-X9-DG protein
MVRSEGERKHFMTAQCPHCGKNYSMTPEQAGQNVRCTGCGKEFSAADSAAGSTAPPLPPVIPEYAGPMPRRPSNGLATASLILGILFFVPFAPFVAIVLGIFGLVRARTPGVPGRKRAIAGIVLGGFFMVMVPVFFFQAFTRAREEAMRIQAMSDLRQIGQAIFMYASQNHSQFPPDFGVIYLQGNVPGTVFINPSTGNALPGNWSSMNSAAQAKWISANSDYSYDASTFPPMTQIPQASMAVMAHEAFNHNGAGSSALFVDGHVEFLTPAALQQALSRRSAIVAGQMLH